MYRYPYVDDPEPKDRPETGEERFIRRGKKVFDWVIGVAGVIFVILFVYGIILRHL